MAKARKRLGILVGGGPAPGINGVIRSVTIEAINSGFEVVGFFDGFKWLREGDFHHAVPLNIRDVSRIHFQGGSILRTARADPTRVPHGLENAQKALTKCGITHLVTIGGDGTALKAYKLSQMMGKKLRLAHVPKTIDNDIPLPAYLPTFGFHTARHYGAGIVNALMEEAKTTQRWFFVVTMGRRAGHLALGIGKAAGATVTVIGEEFGRRQVSLSHLANILEGAIIKRLAMGKPYGVAVLAEGLADHILLEDLKQRNVSKISENVGSLRHEEIELGRMLRDEVFTSLERRGIKMKIVPKDVGYELRCMPPIPFDCEYTQDLGCSAVRFLAEGGKAAVISVKRGGKIDPLPFEDLIDEKTGKIRVREVDLEAESYLVARKYMIRLEPRDFEDPVWLRRLAQTAKLPVKAFVKRFKPVV